MGENLKMPYPQCGRSIKTYARGNNDAPGITMYGSPVRLDDQVVALRARSALSAPPKGGEQFVGSWTVLVGGQLGLQVCWVCTRLRNFPSLLHLMPLYFC